MRELLFSTAIAFGLVGACMNISYAQAVSVGGQGGVNLSAAPLVGTTVGANSAADVGANAPATQAQSSTSTNVNTGTAVAIDPGLGANAVSADSAAGAGVDAAGRTYTGASGMMGSVVDTIKHPIGTVKAGSSTEINGQLGR